MGPNRRWNVRGMTRRTSSSDKQRVSQEEIRGQLCLRRPSRLRSTHDLGNLANPTFVIKAAEPQRTKSRATGAGRSGISLQYCFLTITSTYWARELSTGTQIFGTITRANGLYLYLAAIPRSTTNVCLNQRFVIFSVIHRA